MKKIINIFFVIITIMSSCTTAELDGIENNEVEVNKKSYSEYQELYDEIISIDDLIQQKKIVNSFNEETQAALWNLKIENFIENYNLNSEQLKVIDELKKLITPTNFILIKDKKINKELKSQLESIRFNINEILPNNVGWYLLNYFENVNQTLDKIKSKPKENQNITARAIRDCDCNKDSDCIRLTGLSAAGFQWEYGMCSGSTCYSYSGWWFGLFENDNTKLCRYM